MSIEHISIAGIDKPVSRIALERLVHGRLDVGRGR